MSQTTSSAEPGEGWPSKADYLESVIDSSRRMHHAVDSLLIGLVREGSTFGAYTFQTRAGRPCLITLAIGEDAVNAHVNKINQKEQQNGDPAEA